MKHKESAYYQFFSERNHDGRMAGLRPRGCPVWMTILPERINKLRKADFTLTESVRHATFVISWKDDAGIWMRQHPLDAWVQIRFVRCGAGWALFGRKRFLFS